MCIYTYLTPLHVSLFTTFVFEQIILHYVLYKFQSFLVTKHHPTSTL